MDLQSSVCKKKRRRERIQPCGEPVKVKRMSEKVLLTSTLCDLLLRKVIIHRVSWWFSAKMCGCMVLNAEEKPTYRRFLAVLLGVSRCL